MHSFKGLTKGYWIHQLFLELAIPNSSYRVSKLRLNFSCCLASTNAEQSWVDAPIVGYLAIVLWLVRCSNGFILTVQCPRCRSTRKVEYYNWYLVIRLLHHLLIVNRYHVVIYIFGLTQISMHRLKNFKAMIKNSGGSRGGSLGAAEPPFRT